MAPLSQLELDALCTEAPGGDCPPSPQDSLMKKRRRRISVTAMGAELAALVQDLGQDGPGLSQTELDNMSMPAGDASARSGSPESSSLYRIKRKRLSVRDGEVGAVTRAAELCDTMGASSEAKQGENVLAEQCSPRRNRRGHGIFIKTDENSSPVCSTKLMSEAGPGIPQSPCRGRALAFPLSPSELN